MDILDLKESLRFSIFNTDFMSIDPILLEDTSLVKEVFQECDGLTIQAHFLDRLDLEDILYLCEFDAISEEDLLTIFINTNFPTHKFTDIVLALPIESLFFILAQLREEGVQDVFSIIGAMLDQYQVPVVEEDELSDWIKLMETQCIDTMTSELNSASGDLTALTGALIKILLFPDFGVRVIDTVLEEFEKQHDISSVAIIQGQTLFSSLIKLSYLIALVPELYDRYEKQNRWIEESLMLTLLQLQKEEDVLKFISPWPVATLAKCLELINGQLTHKDAHKRNMALRVKNQLISLSKKECGKLKKAVRRFTVQGYTLGELNE